MHKDSSQNKAQAPRTKIVFSERSLGSFIEKHSLLRYNLFDYAKYRW